MKQSLLFPLLGYHAGITVIFVILAFYFFGFQQSQSTLFGCAIGGLNLFLILWTWERIFSKKSIALAVGVIVFKYAILGWIIYFATKADWLNLVWVVVGFSAILPSLVLWGILANKKRES